MIYHGLAMKRLPVLVAELVLVIAGVFVFRGLWTLLDSVRFMNSALAHWLSLAGGVAASAAALWLIQRQDGG